MAQVRPDAGRDSVRDGDAVRDWKGAERDPRLSGQCNAGIPTIRTMRNRTFLPSAQRRIFILAVSVSMASLAFLGCAEDEAAPELPPRSILWQRVADAAMGPQRVIAGIVTAVSDTRLAFDVGGIVETVEVNLGDRVAKDQVLARLDAEPFELTVADAQAALADARARRESAAADFARTQALFDASVASLQELDRDRARRDSRMSQVDATEARLNLAERDLRRSVLRSPFDGAISVLDVDPAMKVGSGQIVIEMDSGESGLRVEVQMPETLIAGVRQGDAVQVQFPSIGEGRPVDADRAYGAVVSEVGTRASTGNAFPVRADMVEAPPGLRPGMTAEVRFESTASVRADGVIDVEGYLLPIAAVLMEADSRFSVFVFDPETSTVAKRPVRQGGVRDNDVAILEGLEPGEIVATAGVTFLRDGQEVRLVDAQLVRNAP